jgi:hypothetical protein
MWVLIYHINPQSDFLRSSNNGERWEYNETVLHLFIDFKKAYDSVTTEVLYSIPIQFGKPMKFARLIKLCLNEPYSKVYICEHLPDSIPI